MKFNTINTKATFTEKMIFITLFLVFALSFYFKPLSYYKINTGIFSIIPNTSITKTLGIHGPTCGLTRSFVNISHGRFVDGFLANFMGPFTYLTFLFFFFYLGYRSFGGKKQIKPNLSSRQSKIILFSIIAAFIISWIAKIFSGLRFQ